MQSIIKYMTVVFVALSLTGCSKPVVERVPVSGHVLLDGKPLSFGRLKIYPQGVRPAVAKLDAEGRFSLSTYKQGDGVPLGKHPLEVNGGEQLTNYTVRWHAPPKYSNYGTSGLTLEVDGPTDSAVINLTWDGGSPFVENL